MIKDLGQVAAIYIGTTEPINYTLLWLDTNTNPGVYKAYDSNLKQWVPLATQSWVQDLIDNWIQNWPVSDDIVEGDYILINKGGENYKIEAQDIIQNLIGKPLNFQNIVSNGSQLPASASDLKNGDLYILNVPGDIDTQVVTQPTQQVFPNRSILFWDEGEWKSMGRVEWKCDLSMVQTSDTVTINSSLGTGITIPTATDSQAGVLSAILFTYLTKLSNGTVIPRTPNGSTLTPGHIHNYTDIEGRIIVIDTVGDINKDLDTSNPPSQRAVTEALYTKYDKTGGEISGIVRITDGTEATQLGEGALIVNGGLSIFKNVYFGENLDVVGATYLHSTLDVDGITHILNTTNSTANNNGALVVDGGVGIAKNVNIGGVVDVDGNSSLHGTLTVDGATTLNSTLHTVGAVTFDNTLDVAGVSNFNSTIESTAYTNGAVVIDGGVGIAKQLRVGGNTTLGSNFTVGGDSTLAGDLIVNGATEVQDITIHGNVTQEGQSFITQAETVEVKDNILLLNRGETAAGVSKGISGIEVDRGTLPNFQFVFDESDDYFKAGEIGDLQILLLRDADANLTNNKFFYWDNTNKIAKTREILIADISDLGATWDTQLKGAIYQKVFSLNNSNIGLYGYVSAEKIGPIYAPTTMSTNSNQVLVGSSTNIPVWDYPKLIKSFEGRISTLGLGRATTPSTMYTRFDIFSTNTASIPGTDSISGDQINDGVVQTYFWDNTTHAVQLALDIDGTGVAYRSYNPSDGTARGGWRFLASTSWVNSNVNKKLESYLPLTAGSSKPLTGALHINGASDTGINGYGLGLIVGDGTSTRGMEIRSAGCTLGLGSHEDGIIRFWRDSDDDNTFIGYFAEVDAANGGFHHNTNMFMESNKHIALSTSSFLRIPASSSGACGITNSGVSESLNNLSLYFPGDTSMVVGNTNYTSLALRTSASSNLVHRKGTSDYTIYDESNLFPRTISFNNVNYDVKTTIATSQQQPFKFYAPTTAGTSGQILQSTGRTPSWVNTSTITANYLPLSGGTLKGKLTTRGINLSTGGIPSYGISFYNPDFYTWFEYMSQYKACTGADASTYGDVTSWARRSTIEDNSGYGWIWDSCENAENAVPDPKMALSSVTGNLEIKGKITTHAGLGPISSRITTINGIASRETIRPYTFTTGTVNAPGTDSISGFTIDDGWALNFGWQTDYELRLALDLDGTGIAYCGVTPSTNNNKTGWKFLATTEWVNNTYLKLSGGTMTGTIRIPYNGLQTSGNASNSLIFYNATELWYGSLPYKAVFDTSNTDMIHRKNGVNYIIYDASNLGTITFTGAVSATYNGQSNITVNIPQGGGGGTADISISNGPAVSGQYVSGMSESGGVITLTRAALPTLSGGASATSGQYVSGVTVSGHTVTVTKANLPTVTLSSLEITATAAELNKLDGLTATTTELNYVDGVTSNIQTQLNNKAASTHTHPVAQINNLGTNWSARLTAAINVKSVNINGTATSYLNTTNATAVTIYAPTTAGTDGYLLVSNGSGAPSWASVSSVVGTGFVTLDTAQTITGAKTFTAYTIFSNGAGTATSSDKRLKENIKEITYNKGFDEISLYSYNFKGRKEEKIGLIAQEVQKVIPQAVIEDKEGYLAIDTYPIVATLVAANGERVREIKNLKSEIDNLKQEIEILKQEISILKRIVRL